MAGSPRDFVSIMEENSKLAARNKELEAKVDELTRQLEVLRKPARKTKKNKGEQS